VYFLPNKLKIALSPVNIVIPTLGYNCFAELFESSTDVVKGKNEISTSVRTFV